MGPSPSTLSERKVTRRQRDTDARSGGNGKAVKITSERLPPSEPEQSRRLRIAKAKERAIRKLAQCHNPLVNERLNSVVDTAGMVRLVLAFLAETKIDDDGLSADGDAGRSIIHHWLASAIEWAMEAEFAGNDAERAMRDGRAS